MSRSTTASSHWKRKRNNKDRGESNQNYEEHYQDRQRALAVLHIQAHEADIVHGAEGKSRAQSLEVDAHGRPGPGTALIKLNTNANAGAGWNGDEDSVFSLSGTSTGMNKAVGDGVHAQGVWVDRYVDFPSVIILSCVLWYCRMNEMVSTK